MSDEVQIRRLVPADAEQLKACFERCYGTSYVAGFFYEPAQLHRRIESGRLRSVVAEIPEGQIVGHMGLTVRNAAARTADAGNTIVDPDFRGQQIVMHLGAALNTLCAEEGFLGYHHYPTTVHKIMQKLSVADNGTEMGVMLGYIPVGTEYREFEGKPFKHRPAVTVVWRPFAPCPPRTVYVPESYGDTVATAYQRAALDRTFGESDGGLLGDETTIEAYDDQRRGVLRIEVTEPGRSLAEAIDMEVSGSRAEVIHIDLPLGHPSTPTAAQLLRKQRYLFCAVLPEYREGDVLRMQRMRDNSLPRPKLVNPDAKDIFRLIEREHTPGVAPLAG